MGTGSWAQATTVASIRHRFKATKLSTVALPLHFDSDGRTLSYILYKRVTEALSLYCIVV